MFCDHRASNESFKQQVALIRHQTNELCQKLKHAQTISPEVLISVLAQLQLTLEEFQVAQDKLQQQWETLEQTNQKAELLAQQMYAQIEQRVQEQTQHLIEMNARLLQEIQQHKQSEELLHQQAERERLIESIAYQIRKSLELNEILETTATEVRQFLQTDRVIIYRFKPDWNGVVTVESVAPGWMSILYTTIEDACFRTGYVSQYQAGRVRAIDDIYTADLRDCYREMLATYQVRANLVVPILQDDQLWGLLIAHQCRGPRQWAQTDISLLRQLSTQIAIAIKQSELYQQVQELAIVDGLTQVANRRRFDEVLKQTWNALRREQCPLSLLLVDVDFFKKYNDTYGHLAGDECLRAVARVLSHNTKRTTDLVARYGGEEFGVILPNTDLEGALHQAEAMCTAVWALKMLHTGSPTQYLTVSIGVATMVPNEREHPASLIALADQALYQAKTNGRNQVGVLQTNR